MAADKKDKVLNVPNLRFPEFKEEWHTSTIDDVTSEFQSGKFIKADLIHSNGSVPVYGGNGLRGFTDTYNHIGDYVLIGRQGALCGNIRFVTGETYITEHAIAVKGTENNDTKYLQYLFERMNLGQYSDQSAQPGLAVSKLIKLKITIPQEREQSKIARFLTTIDERILTQIRIIDKLQSLMKGLNDYLQDTVPLSYSLSFSDIGKDYSGLSGKSAGDFGSGKPYITYVSIYANNFVDDNCSGKVSVERGEKQNVVQKGDMLFTLSSETPEEVCYGAVYSGNSTETYLNSFCFGIRNTEEKVFSPYMAYFFNSSRFRREVYPLAQGSTRFNLQKTDFLQKQFSYPSIEDQHRIFEILNAYDNKIKVENQILAHYQLQKEFLLRNLFI